MYTRIVLSGFIRIAFVVSIVGSGVSAAAQTPAPAAQEPHQHAGITPEPEHGQHELKTSREGSGTGWLPDITPMYAIHLQRGPWQLMVHENVGVTDRRKVKQRERPAARCAVVSRRCPITDTEVRVEATG